jgi:hypothetical protein
MVLSRVRVAVSAVQVSRGISRTTLTIVQIALALLQTPLSVAPLRSFALSFDRPRD